MNRQKIKRKLSNSAMHVVELCVGCGLSGVVGGLLRWVRSGYRLYVSRATTAARYATEYPEQCVITYLDKEPRQLIYALPDYEGQGTELHRVEHPSRYVMRLNNATVVGASNLVLTDDGWGINDMFVQDTLARIRFNGRAFRGAVGRHKIISLLPDRKPVPYIERGVMLSANFSLNYYHFTFEILPRFMELDRIVPPDVPLIIDRHMTRYAQFNELLAYFNTAGRKLIVIEPEEPVWVGELYWPSITPYIVPDVRRIAWSKADDSAFDTEALDFVRKRMLELRSSREFPRRVFLCRRGGVRGFNQDEVMDALLDKGFEQVETDGMSVADQVALFHSAEIIVSGSGAALTNILYCDSECQIFVITRSTFPEIAVFSSIAAHVGAQMRYISAGIPLSDDPMDFHKEFRIDSQIVKTLILDQKIVNLQHTLN